MLRSRPGGIRQELVVWDLPGQIYNQFWIAQSIFSNEIINFALRFQNELFTMKNFYFTFFFTCFFLCSCGGNLENQFILKVNTKAKVQKGKEFSLSVKSKKNIQIDSVHYFYAGRRLSLNKNSEKVKISSPLGKNKLKAEVFTSEGKASISKKLVVHNNVAPEIYTFKVINTFPHDSKSFTQGLEFYRDTLYESAGHYGKSNIRKVDLKSGKILKQHKLKDNYFAEGLSIMNDQLYVLTWRSGDGFVFNPKNLKRKKTFNYNKSKEGWGLCNDGEKLYKSDGTAKIWILNPETLKEERYIQPVTHKSLSTKLNELEWVNGKIYANTWNKDGVAIINPKSGAIEGLIDFRGLKKQLGNPKKANVLNGIAYDAKRDKLYVTGKNWDKLFEVKIIKK